jgi:phosphate butyryltransferase
MTIATFAQMVAAARAGTPLRIGVAAAADREVLESVAQARQEGIVEATLVGDEPAIRQIADEIGFDLGSTTVLHEPEAKRAAVLVVSLAAGSSVDTVVKGHLKTEELLGAALRREGGIRQQSLMTHVGIFEIPRLDRLIYISDSGVVLYPDICQRLEIIQNAVDVAHCFGLQLPKVALLSSSEEVHPDLPVSIESLAISRMAQQGWAEGAVVDGPLSLDVAISPHAARVKAAGGPVAGQADILIVSSVESGNIMAKSIQYFARGRMAGLVVGARTPVIINSRADSAETRFLSLAMAAIIVNHQRQQKPTY